MGDNSDLDTGFISGTCNAMCPESEKQERVARKLVHVSHPAAKLHLCFHLAYLTV